MANMMLTWQQAAAVTLGLVLAAALLFAVPTRATRWLAPVARESALIAGLYALWQYAGTFAVTGTQHALARARWIEHTERAAHLPSEVGLQHVVTAQPVIAELADLYYATMHFTIMFVFLLWLFLRHRDSYPRVRRVLALTTFACLLVQLVPVAPPRLLPGLGFVDTAAVHHQSVYALGIGDSMSAMPSVHVAWAALVAWAVLTVGRGPWRWLGPAHLVVTVVVVVSTANHFWADGIVAVSILAVCIGLERAGSTLAARLVQRHRPVLLDALADVRPAADSLTV